MHIDYDHTKYTDIYVGVPWHSFPFPVLPCPITVLTQTHTHTRIYTYIHTYDYIFTYIDFKQIQINYYGILR